MSKAVEGAILLIEAVAEAGPGGISQAELAKRLGVSEASVSRLCAVWEAHGYLEETAKSADELVFALLAELVELDGRRVVLEDLYELGLRDVLALQQAVLGDFLPSPAPRPSSTSAGSPAGATPSSAR